jgi:outer membrane immunogenic protein
MRKALLASVSAAALSCSNAMPSQAAPPPLLPITWSGFYVGANAGYAWSRSNPTLIVSPNSEPIFFTGTNGNPPDLNPRGFIGGGQAGYNWQTGPWVFGGEVDFSGINASADSTVSPFFTGKASNTVSWSSRYDWLFTARVRGGITLAPNWLLYLTGGLAVTHVRDSAVCSSVSSGCLDSTAPQLVTWTDSKTLAGGTIGGGLEYMFAQHWSARLEYLYTKFQDTSPTASTANGTLVPVPPAFSFSHNLSLARFAINYKFGP